MPDEKRNEKAEQDAKVRCAQFLLDMYEKYGAEILKDNKKKDDDKEQ